jgi:hypothetical protein
MKFMLMEPRAFAAREVQRLRVHRLADKKKRPGASRNQRAPPSDHR